MPTSQLFHAAIYFEYSVFVTLNGIASLFPGITHSELKIHTLSAISSTGHVGDVSESTKQR